MTDVIVWFDPGKVTGVASWDHRVNVFTSIEVADDLVALGNWIEMLLLINDNDPDFRLAIGWEMYIITPGNTRHGTAYWSLETIGVLKYFSRKYNSITMLPPQTSSMMTPITDEKLKVVGWYKPGKPHANDAARHLARYMLKAGTLPIELWDKMYCDEVLDV